MKDIRTIGGNVSHRRDAFLFRRDRSRFGIIKAVNLNAVCQQVAVGCDIETAWLTQDELTAVERGDVLKASYCCILGLSAGYGATFLG